VSLLTHLDYDKVLETLVSVHHAIRTLGNGDTGSRWKTAGVITNGVSPIEIQLPNRRSVDQELFSR
jgi:hypothetical protein